MFAHQEAELEGRCHGVGGLEAAAHPVGRDPGASQRQRGVAPQLRVEYVSGAHKVGKLEALPALQGRLSLNGHQCFVTALQAAPGHVSIVLLHQRPVREALYLGGRSLVSAILAQQGQMCSFTRQGPLGDLVYQELGPQATQQNGRVRLHS